MAMNRGTTAKQAKNLVRISRTGVRPTTKTTKAPQQGRSFS